MAKKIGDYSIGVKYEVDRKSLDDLQNSLNSIQGAAQNSKMNGTLTKELQDAAKMADKVGDILEASFNKDLGTLNVTKFMQTLKQSNITVKQMASSFAAAGDIGASAFAKITSMVMNTRLQVQQTNKLLSSMYETLTNSIRWSISSSVINNISGSIQKAYGFVQDLDKSLNDIRIVTGKSAEEMDNFAIKANQAAKNLGQTTTAYTEASLIYYQQGLDDTEAQARADVTLKAANVTGQSAEAVSEQLTAVWNGYKVSAEEAELYIDRLAAVAASSASNLEELSVGMSKVASAANAMGVGEEQLAAQISTIISTTRQAPESVGTALKTIYARMSDIKMGSDEAEITLGNYTEKMAQMGVNVLDANGQLREMGDVIEEIGDKWQSMSKEQQVALAQTMAGTRQYNNLIALFENWDQYTEMLNIASDAQGTLQEQEDIYMESTAAHLKTLKATWEDLYATIFKTDEINTLIDLGTNLVQVFDNFFDSFGGGIKSIVAFGSIVANVFSKQIQGSIMSAVEAKNKMQLRAADLQGKADFAQAYTEQFGGFKTDDANIARTTAETEKQLECYERMKSVQDSLSEGRYNELMDLQEELSTLEGQIQQRETENQILTDKYKIETNFLDTVRGNLSEVEKEIVAQEQIVETSQEQLNYINQIIVLREKSSLLSDEDYMGEQSYLQEQAKELNMKEDLVEKSMKELQQEKEKYELLLAQNAAKKEILENEQDRIINSNRKDIAQNNFDANIKVDFDAQALSNNVNALISGFSVLSSTIMGVNSVFYILNNENATFEEKLSQILMTISIMGPSLLSSISKFSKAFSFLKSNSLSKEAFKTTEEYKHLSLIQNDIEKNNIKIENSQRKTMELLQKQRVEAIKQLKLKEEQLKLEKQIARQEQIQIEIEETKNKLAEVQKTVNNIKKGKTSFSSNSERDKARTQALLEQGALQQKLNALTSESTMLENTKANTLQRLSEIEGQLAAIRTKTRLQIKNAIKNSTDLNQKQKEEIVLLKEKFKDETSLITLQGIENSLNKAENLEKEAANGIDEKGNILTTEEIRLKYAAAKAKRESAAASIEEFTAEKIEQGGTQGYISNFSKTLTDFKGKAKATWTEFGQLAEKMGTTAGKALASIGVVAAAAAVAIIALSVAFKQAEKYQENLIKKSEENAQKTREQADASREQANSISEVSNSLRELEQSSNGNKVVTEELRSQIIELCDQYDLQDLKIQALIGDYNTLTQAMKEAEQVAKNKALSDIENQYRADSKLLNAKTLEANNKEGFGQYIWNWLGSQGNIMAGRNSLGGDFANFYSFGMANNLKNKWDTSSGLQINTGAFTSKREADFINQMASLIGGSLTAGKATAGYAYAGGINFSEEALIQNWDEIQTLMGEFPDLVNNNVYTPFVRYFESISDTIDDAQAALNSKRDLKAQDIANNLSTSNDYYNDRNAALAGFASYGGFESQEEAEKYFTSYALQQGGETATNEIISQFAEKFNQNFDSVKEKFAEFSDLELQSLYLNLDAADAFSNLDAFKIAYEDLIKYTAANNEIDLVLNTINEADKNGGMSKEEATSFYKSSNIGETLEISENDFAGMDWATQRTLMLQYYEEERKQQELIAANDEARQENLQNQIDELTQQLTEEVGSEDIDYSDEVNVENLKQTTENAFNLIESLKGKVAEEYKDDFQKVIDEIADGKTWEEATQGLEKDAKDAIAKAAEGVLTPSNYQQIIKNTKAYGKFTKNINTLGKSLSKLDKPLKNNEEDWKRVKKNLELVNSNIDELQSAYGTLSGAVKEYNKSGNISIDTLQSLLNMDSKYLASLEFKNGQLQLNTDTMQAMALAQLDLAEAEAYEQAMTEISEANEQSYSDAMGVTTNVIGIESDAIKEMSNAAAQGLPALQAWMAAAASFDGTNQAAFDNATKALYNKLQLIGAARKSIKSNFGKAMGGSRSGGGGGSKKDPEFIDYLEDERDRYHDINIQISLCEKALEKLSSQQDKLVGGNLAKNLMNQSKQLQKQVLLNKEKLKIMKEESAELQKQLGDKGVTFADDGTISNYGDIMADKLDYVNELTEKYNKMSAAEQEKFKDTLDKAKKDYEKFKENIERYDELISEKMPEIEQKVQDLTDQKIDLQIEAFSIEINAKLNLAEAQRQWNQFLQDVVYKDKSTSGNAERMRQDLLTYYNPIKPKISSKDIAMNTQGITTSGLNGRNSIQMANGGIIQDDTNRVNELMEQLRQMEETGTSSVYGDNKQKLLEDLKAANDQLMEDMTSFEELVEQVNQEYLNAIDNVASTFETLNKEFEYTSSLIQHDMKIIQQLYGDDYAAMDKYYDKQTKNYNDQLSSQKEMVSYWKDLMDKEEVGSDAWKKYKEEWQNATSELNSTVEASIENLLNKYQNTINQIMNDMNNKLTNGKGLNYAKSEWDLVKKESNMYLDNIEGAYAISQLQSKYQKSIDSTTSVTAQKKLNDLMNEEIEMLKEKDKLTQYDIDRANAKYDLTLKQIALEEAQQNKSQMRLKRDSQGNYSYQYAADDAAIAEAEDGYNNALNKLYKIDKDEYNKNLDDIFNYYQEWQQKIAEAAQIKDDEERERTLRLYEDHYGKIINGLVEENEVIKQNLYESTEIALEEYYVDNAEAFKNMTDEEKMAWMGEEGLIPGMLTSVQELVKQLADPDTGFGYISGTVMQEIISATEEYKQSLADLEAAAGVNFENIKNGIDPVIHVMDELIDKDKEELGEMEKQLKKTKEIKEEVDKLYKSYEDVKNKAVEAATKAKEAWEDGTTDGIDNLNNKILEMIKNINKMISDINEGWKSIKTDYASPSSGGSGGGSGSGSYSPVGPGGGTTKENHTIQIFDHGSSYGSNLRYIVEDGKKVKQYIPEDDVIKYFTAKGIAKGNVQFWLRNLGKTFTARYDTGGYTGNWNSSEGKMAMLHEKELVLNKEDTKNMLNAVSIVRNMSGLLNSLNDSMLARVSGLQSLGELLPSNYSGNQGEIKQNVTINASFPAATNRDEISAAFDNLIGRASQFVNIKNI